MFRSFPDCSSAKKWSPEAGFSSEMRQVPRVVVLVDSSSTASSAWPKVDVPKQLTLERAEEILLQNNLTVTAARYGVEVARAQKLIAGLRPNPTVTLGAEQIDIGHPFHNLFSTDSNTAAN